MFRPAIQKTWVLVGIASVNIILFAIASNMTVIQEARGYELKMAAAQLMKSAMTSLKEHRMGESGIFVDVENDPNETALVGPQFSLITTDEGDLDHKLTSLNPNFAALIVDLFLEARVKEGDKVAVSLTGSMPGANLAVLAACVTLNLEPVIIASVGASQWGATDPYFTWLDIENTLFEMKVIPFRSAAASIGGKGDTGKGISVRGRELLWEAIYRNNIPLIQEATLQQSIDKRMEIYSAETLIQEFAVFINVGGGAAGIGPSINARLIPNGVSLPAELRDISGSSVVREFARAGVAVIQVLNIPRLVREFEMPIAPTPLPEIGAGQLFSIVRYNIWISTLALLLAAGLVISVGIYSHRQIKHRMETYEPDSIL